MTKMIVIGAGVMGASVAFRLAQAGADVTVLEATRIGGAPPAPASPGSTRTRSRQNRITTSMSAA